MNLNKNDVQSKAIYSTDGVVSSLYAGECRHGGGECYIIRRENRQMAEEFMNPPVDDGEYAVRRLMPCECAALQGFPKDWCDDVPHSDSAEYKLWGNGIALPSILGIIQNAVRVCEERQVTDDVATGT